MQRLWPIVLGLVLIAGLAFGLQRGIGGFGGQPNLEQETRFIAAELSCPVCAGQSVAESNSTVAVQMRSEIREQLQLGQSRAQILSMFKERHGEWIINQPPTRGFYSLIWAAPFLVLIGGLWGLTQFVKRQRLAQHDISTDDEPNDSERLRAADDDGQAEAIAAKLRDYL